MVVRDHYFLRRCFIYNVLKRLHASLLSLRCYWLQCERRLSILVYAGIADPKNTPEENIQSSWTCDLIVHWSVAEIPVKTHRLNPVHVAASPLSCGHYMTLLFWATSAICACVWLCSRVSCHRWYNICFIICAVAKERVARYICHKVVARWKNRNGLWIKSMASDYLCEN